MDLRELARALGGEVSGGQVIAPGPGHSRRDRSMTVRLSPSAPDGFLTFSHTGDPFQLCRDHVRARLGLDRGDWKRKAAGAHNPYGRAGKPDAEIKIDNVKVDHPSAGIRRLRKAADDGNEKTALALALWDASIDPRGTPAEVYFASRALAFDDDIAGSVIRWNARISAVVALFRNIRTGEPQAVGRTLLDANARKIERKFLGPVGGAAIMLDGFEAVTGGLHVGEGVETCQAARQLGLRPAWALGSAGAIAAFPVLGGIECLTLLAEHDDASAKAVQACGARWHAAGREVLINHPIGGKDLNDAVRATA